MDEPDHVRMTRQAYDGTADLYVQFIGTEMSTDIEAPLDLSLLDEFARRVALAPGALVADVGCGPGRAAAFLAARRLEVIGFDVSPVMLDLARAAHPGIRFEAGLLTRLPLPDHSLAGAVCWYSIIHTPPELLDEVAAELTRVLAPGAPLLVAFQAGDGEAVRRDAVHGRAVSLTSYRHDPLVVARRLADGGLQVDEPVVRAAAADHESTPQAFISARAGDLRG